MKTVLERNDAIKKAHKQYQDFSGDQQYRDLYQARLKWQHDQISLINSARKEGKLKVKQDSALRMKKKGYPVQDISEITGLSIKEIEAL